MSHSLIFFNTLESNQCYNGYFLSKVLDILITTKSVDVDRKNGILDENKTTNLKINYLIFTQKFPFMTNFTQNNIYEYFSQQTDGVGVQGWQCAGMMGIKKFLLSFKSNTLLLRLIHFCSLNNSTKNTNTYAYVYT